MKGFGQKDKFQIKKIINQIISSQNKKPFKSIEITFKGKIKEAAIYYQYFINQGFQDGNVFKLWSNIRISRNLEAEKFLEKQ